MGTAAPSRRRPYSKDDFFAYILGAAAGLLLALGGLSRRRAIARCCLVYIEFIRGTPTLTQLFLIYFGLASFNIIIPNFAVQ